MVPERWVSKGLARRGRGVGAGFGRARGTMLAEVKTKVLWKTRTDLTDTGPT